MLAGLVVGLLAAIPAFGQGTFAPADPAREAAEALARDDFKGAAPWLEQAVAADPGNVELRFNLAFAYTQLDRDREAAEQYQKTLALKPDLTPARRNLAMVLLRAERFADAAPHLQALLEGADDSQTRLYLARALSQSGRLDEGLAEYRRLAEAAPGDPHLRLEMGQTLVSAGRIEEAAAEYRRAGEIDPALASHELELAESVERAGEKDRAIRLYLGYLDKFPDEAAVLERVALLLMEAGRAAEALAPLEKVTAASPTAANWAALAEARSAADDAGGAVEAWGRAIEAEPSSAELRLRRAALLLKAANYEQAGSDYMAAVKLDGARVEGWNGLAFCLFQVENYPDALRALDEAERRGEVKPANLYLRAIMQDKLQLYPEAKVSYEAFVAANPPMEEELWKAGQRLQMIERILRKR